VRLSRACHPWRKRRNMPSRKLNTISWKKEVRKGTPRSSAERKTKYQWGRKDFKPSHEATVGGLRGPKAKKKATCGIGKKKKGTPPTPRARVGPSLSHAREDEEGVVFLRRETTIRGLQYTPKKGGRLTSWGGKGLVAAGMKLRFLGN